MGHACYSYATDIQQGFVTGKHYTPEYTQCHTDEDGFRRCEQVGPFWSVVIANNKDNASWPVTQEEYESIQYGDWYCYVDLFHDAVTCDPPPNER